MFWSVGDRVNFDAIDLDDCTYANCDTFRDLYDADEAFLAAIPVPRGEAVPVHLGFSFPLVDFNGETGEADAAYHRPGAFESKLLEFDVLIHMTGNLPGQAPVVPTPPQLPVTGAAIMGALSLAGALGIFGWLFMAAGRRRRCDNCDSPLPMRNRDDVCEGAPLTCELAMQIAAAA
jgi:hypothetical protein